MSNNVTVIPAKKSADSSSTSASGNKLRVAAYCRVSTAEENQLNSYATQISYYTEFINSDPNWKLAGIYADEGISGTQTANRTEFNKMIRAAKRGKIDLILCKSISRFARNTVDCLDYVRQLKALNVTVIFEKENINTSSMTSEFAISLYASFAQAESESISKNITWGIEKGFKEGKVRYQLEQMIGYKMGEDGVPYIIEEEAEIIRKIFTMYIEGHTSGEIAAYLTEKCVKRRNGNSSWNRNNILQILKNEKYVGDAILQKTYTVNCITHERAKNTGQKTKYFVQDCHPAIIDRDTFDRVRLELEKRRKEAKRGAKEVGRYHTKYCLSRLLFCPFCGANYKRTTWLIKGEKMGIWRCASRLEKRSCPRSVSYHEDILQKSIIAAINRFVGDSSDVEKEITESVERIESENEEIKCEIADLTQKLGEISSSRDDILECISGNVFDQLSDELKNLNREEKEIAVRLDGLNERLENNRRGILKADTAKELFRDLKPLTTFNQGVIDRLVERIEAVGKNEIAVTFCGGFRVVQEVSSP